MNKSVDGDAKIVEISSKLPWKRSKLGKSHFLSLEWFCGKLFSTHFSIFLLWKLFVDFEMLILISWAEWSWYFDVNIDFNQKFGTFCMSSHHEYWNFTKSCEFFLRTLTFLIFNEVFSSQTRDIINISLNITTFIHKNSVRWIFFEKWNFNIFL